MAYCRWSSDDFRCDLYCYESDTFTTHVAGNRIVGDIPEVPRLEDTDESRTAWTIASAERSAFLENCDRVDIELPHVGETFYDPDLESFLERLLHLRSVGYIFPDRVLDRVRDEIAELKSASPK